MTGRYCQAKAFADYEIFSAGMAVVGMVNF